MKYRTVLDMGIITRLRRALVCAAIAVLAIPRVAGADDNSNVAPREDYAAIATALRSMINHEMQDKELPAFSIALVDENQIAWAEGFGYQDPDRKIRATADTVYRVGSVSKLFTDIGVMQMVEGGKIDLDASVNKYLADFHPKNPFS